MILSLLVVDLFSHCVNYIVFFWVVCVCVCVGMMTMSYNVVFVLVKPRWVLYILSSQEREVEGGEEEKCK